MPRQAIKQAEHIDCDEADELPDGEPHFSVQDKEFVRDEHSTIRYDVRCVCGHEAEVEVSKLGTSADDSITYENASWNQTNDED